jgi:hypothetical protein
MEDRLGAKISESGRFLRGGLTAERKCVWETILRQPVKSSDLADYTDYHKGEVGDVKFAEFTSLPLVGF